MKNINPYLIFDGNAQEAFDFYRSVFGGEFSARQKFKDIPEPDKTAGGLKSNEDEKLIHIALPIGPNSTLMASDAPESKRPAGPANNIFIFVETDGKPETEKIFYGLAAGAKIEMALADTFWGSYYGMLVDKFGIGWMVGYAYPKEKKEFAISREFNAPRAKVWRAWTDPEIVKKWWGPKDFTAPVIKIDFRAGGKYLYSMRGAALPGAADQDFWNTGTFEEIIPLEKIVFSDSFADKDGNIVPATYYGLGPGFPLKQLGTVTFEESQGKTKLSVKYDDVSGIGAQDLENMRQGWLQSLDKLAQALDALN